MVVEPEQKQAVRADNEEKLLRGLEDCEAVHLFATWLRLKVITWFSETSMGGKVRLLEVGRC